AWRPRRRRHRRRQGRLPVGDRAAVDDDLRLAPLGAVTVLALVDVGFAYGPRRVLDRVTLEVARAEIVCVIGPNGAGKSTLLRLAAGLVVPGSGRITVGDVDPRALPRRALARRLAMLPQDYHIVFPFTVADVVLM